MNVLHQFVHFMIVSVTFLSPLLTNFFLFSDPLFHSSLSAYVLPSLLLVSVFLRLHVQVAESKVPPFDLGFMYLFKRDD